MNYFGTDLNNYGHYLWDVEGDRLKGSRLDQFNLPFSVESPQLTGEVYGGYTYHVAFGYTIIAFKGSPKDHRGGTKSIFFVKELLAEEEMCARIWSTEIGKKLVRAICAQYQRPIPLIFLK